ncbi:MAG: hypothetical protein K2M12_01935, partial [Muribaculaceae bacterium]|nr:hypothetical protein [Muribaculaceae bacterium]
MIRFREFAARQAATLYWLLVLTLMTVELTVFWVEIAPYNNKTVCAAISLAETMTLLCPYWWLPRKWRAAVLIPSWIMTVFYIANILNFRFWERLLPFMLATQAGNANGVLVHSALGVARWSDVLFFAVPVVLTTVWFIRPVRRNVMRRSYPVWLRLDATMLTIVAFLAAQYVMAISYFPMKDKSVKAVYNMKFFTPRDAYLNTETSVYFLMFGQNLYILYQLSTILSDSHVDLSPQQHKSLEEFCTGLDPQEVSMQANRGKNLIFIIVESLDAEIVGRTLNGREITPNLNALARSNTSVSCLRVRPQIGEGNSCDGQLMYNVGLLPTTRYVGGADYVPALYRLPAMSRQLADSVPRVAVFADQGNG